MGAPSLCGKLSARNGTNSVRCRTYTGEIQSALHTQVSCTRFVWLRFLSYFLLLWISQKSEFSQHRSREQKFCEECKILPWSTGEVLKSHASSQLQAMTSLGEMLHLKFVLLAPRPVQMRSLFVTTSLQGIFRPMNKNYSTQSSWTELVRIPWNLLSYISPIYNTNNAFFQCKWNDKAYVPLTISTKSFL